MPFTLVTEEIVAEKDEFIREIEESGSYSFPPSEEYPLADLTDGKKGMMFALLVARTSTGEKKILRGFSGLAKGRCTIPGYVPPCYSANEFTRIAESYDKTIKDLGKRILEGEDLSEERRKTTHEALARLNELYSFTDIDSNRFGLDEIGKDLPTGTGDCAGIKVLNQAFRKGWQVEGFVEFYYGKDTAERKSGEIYPPCRSRCEKLIERMLKLSFVYVCDDFAIVDKPAGLLSVPGRGEDKADCVSARFHRLFPSSPEQCFVHRLDMDTSGLLVLARNRQSHRKLSMAFEDRLVRKEYEALLEGRLETTEGTIDLPIRSDPCNRPYQVVDIQNGKRSVTGYKVLGFTTIDGVLCTRVRFFPETGRTHQIRVHSAYGLGHPIKGDRLYGSRKEGERLLLHAALLSFPHPSTGETMTFTSEVPF